MVIIESFRTDLASDMEKYLQEKHELFKSVEVLGITTFAGRLTVFVKLGADE
jgi:hypothetical protein